MDMNLVFLKELVSVLPLNVAVKDKDGRYLFCSHSAAKSYNLSSPQEIVGKTIYDLVKKSIADHVTKFDEEAISTQQRLTERESRSSDDGIVSNATITRIPFNDIQTSSSGLITICQEEIDQEQAQQKIKFYEQELKSIRSERLKLSDELENLHEIIALMPGNVYWKNRSGVYLGCNYNILKLINASSRQDVIGKTLEEIIGKNDGDVAHVVSNEDERIMALGFEHSIEEDAFDSKGNHAVYLTRKVPLKDKQGHVNGLLGISIDISERKKYEEQLKIANQVKMDFIHNMEHDIRTPCAGIYYLANNLFEKENDSEKKELLNYLAMASKELLDFCNGVLDFSNIEHGNRPVIVKKFELKKLVDSVVAMEMPAAKNKNLELIAAYDESISAILLGDDYRLQRILINLLSNAIKFTQAGSIKVELYEIQKKGKSVLIKIVVKDTGSGIPKEKLEYIYEKFTRGTPANQGVHKGLGLGLRVVKQFVEEMEGEIEVNSEVGKGSAFVCILPFKLPLSNETTSKEE